MSRKVSAIIPAAGTGERMAGDTPKQFSRLGELPVLAWSILALAAVDSVQEIIVGVREEQSGRVKKLQDQLAEKKSRRSAATAIKVVIGGPDRQATVRNCLAAVRPETEIVLIHDAARPFVSVSLIRAVLAEAKAKGAATAALRPADTIKIRDDKTGLAKNLDRDHLWMIQTPQAFRLETIVQAHEAAQKEGFHGTDDTVLVERMGPAVAMVPGEAVNLKITTPEDRKLASALVAAGLVKPAGRQNRKVKSQKSFDLEALDR